MTTTPTTAPTAEELARAITLPDDLSFKDKDRLRSAIAAAISQHSAPLEAQIAELTAERDAARRECLSARLIGEVRAEKAEGELAAAQERERAYREALLHAEEFITASEHGDNCFLHDTGEFARCRCGKDSALEAVVDALAALQTKEDVNGR